MPTNPLTYSIQNDFLGSFSSANFANDIRTPANGVERALSHIVTNGDAIQVHFVGSSDIAQSDVDLIQGASYPTPVGGLIAAHDATPAAEPALTVQLDAAYHQKTPEGLFLVSPMKSFEIPSVAYCTPNYADKTTWWYESTRVTDEVATDSGDGKTWTLANGADPLVCVYRLTDGDLTNHLYSPASYRVIVKRNGVDISADEYGYEGGSTASGKTYPYQVNYTTGAITFDVSQAGQSITASYSKGLYGRFRLTAPAGHKLCLEHVELQFTTEHGAWLSPMEFVAIFDGSPTDTEVVVGVYRNMADILNKFNPGSLIPPAGEFTKSIYQLPYVYPSGYTIVPTGTAITKSNTMHGLELRMKYPTISFDPTLCEIATATFYCYKAAI